MQPFRRSFLAVALALSFGLVAAGSRADELTVEHIEPVGDLYTQIVAVESNGVRTLYISGQVSGGETLEEQSRGAYGQLAKRLEANGATVDDIVKLVTYVVDWSYDKSDAAFAGFYEVFEGGADTTPAHTLVGVQSLYSPRALLEVEAIAVVPAD